jgi:hypothetical protein
MSPRAAYQKDVGRTFLQAACGGVVFSTPDRHYDILSNFVIYFGWSIS